MNAIYRVTPDYNDVKVLKQIATFGKKTTAKTNISKLNVITFVVYEEYFDVFATDSYALALVRFSTERERKTIMFVEDPKLIAVKEEEPIAPLVFSVSLYEFNKVINDYLKTYNKAQADKNTVLHFMGNFMVQNQDNYTHSPRTYAYVDSMSLKVNNSYSDKVYGYPRNLDGHFNVYKSFLSDSKNSHNPDNDNKIKHSAYNPKLLEKCIKLLSFNNDTEFADFTGYDGEYGHALYMDKVAWSDDNVTWKKIWLMPINRDHYRSEDKSKYGEYTIKETV